MESINRRQLTLNDYLEMQYRFDVIADVEGGWVIEYPDLPGCITVADTADEIMPMAEDVRRLWITTAFEDGDEIPLPTYPEEYSGKFNLRLPKSLHRKLAESAEQEGVSLNQYVVMLLSRGDAQQAIQRELSAIREQIEHSASGKVAAAAD